MKKTQVLVVGAALAMALAGCSKNDSADVQQNPSAATQPAAADTAATPASASPLTADQISVKLSLEAQPKVDSDAGIVEFVVKVENNGSATLSGTGNPPVNLGVQVEATENGADGIRDFSRTPLPQIAAGSSASVVVQIPADAKLKGRKLKIDLVQEGVSWFADLGQPTLEVGPIDLGK